MANSVCHWCGAAFERSTLPTGGLRPRHRESFCKPACRKAFNNLRAVRGAELYDLFRAIRRERKLSGEIDLWTDICRLEQKWQAEDERDRPGRRSYIEPRRAVMRLMDAGRISRAMTGNAVREDAERRLRANAVIQKKAVDVRSQMCDT